MENENPPQNGSLVWRVQRLEKEMDQTVTKELWEAEKENWKNQLSVITSGIKRLEDRNQWLTRAIGTAAIALAANFVFLFLTMGVPN